MRRLLLILLIILTVALLVLVLRQNEAALAELNHLDFSWLDAKIAEVHSLREAAIDMHDLERAVRLHDELRRLLGTRSSLGRRGDPSSAP